MPVLSAHSAHAKVEYYGDHRTAAKKMAVKKFPDPRSADEYGIVAIGGDLEPSSVLLAYRSGIFPWPDPNFAPNSALMIWASPAERGILEFEDLHIPRSLNQARKKTDFKFTIDRAFSEVIARCAAVPRPDQDGTWITREMIMAYQRLHELGHAHSVEVWEDATLVGGIYGVEVEGVFAGESMFYDRPNASKLALLHLIDHLRTQGATWMDIQVLTPHMAGLGAKLISRDEFLEKLKQTQQLRLSLFD